jgi:hypothetical protein
MGMFDIIHMDDLTMLPISKDSISILDKYHSTLNELEFQTKDLSCILNTYRITSDLKLAAVVKGFTEELTYVKFHGIINYYFYSRLINLDIDAKFSNGRLTEIYLYDKNRKIIGVKKFNYLQYLIRKLLK